MVTFRNNNQRRNNFRRNDRTFKVGGDRNKFNNNFSNNDSFQRKLSNRNNHNASKLVEKYNLLAKEALTSGDRTLSENYYQHADHFMRIVYEKNLAQKQNNSQINEQKVIADEKNLTNKSKEEEKK